MKQRSLSSVAADVLVAGVSLVVGLIAALYFHGRWHYHGCMDLFGDPPMGNSSYSRFAPLFEAAPYVAGGLVAGIIAGFGRPQLICVAIRGSGPFFLFWLLSSKNDQSRTRFPNSAPDPPIIMLDMVANPNASYT